MKPIAIAAALLIAPAATLAAEDVPFSCIDPWTPGEIPNGWVPHIYNGQTYVCPRDASVTHKPTMADDIKDILKRLDRIETLLEMK